MIFTLYGDYISHYGNEIWIGSLIRLLQAFGHKEQAVRAAISRMNKQGWVKANRKGNKSYYRLTERGVNRMGEAATRIFKLNNDHWDGKWRMFSYTIPEEKRAIRDDLRKELVWSGFGPLTNSFWISPNRLEEQVGDLIEKYDIQPYVHFFISEYKGPNPNKALVERCWDLGDTNTKYETFIQTYGEKYIRDNDHVQGSTLSDRDCFVERTRLVHEYRKFLFVDPGLPAELLPSQWLGNEAAALFSNYYKILAEPAGRFFESVYRENNMMDQTNGTYHVMTYPFLKNDH